MKSPEKIDLILISGRPGEIVAFYCIADIIDECRPKSSAAMRNDGSTVCGHGFIVLWLPVRFP